MGALFLTSLYGTKILQDLQEVVEHVDATEEADSEDPSKEPIQRLHEIVEDYAKGVN